MFNLNDPPLGPGRRLVNGNVRGQPARRRAASRPGNTTTAAGQANQGPPDLDELWRDFNRKLGGLFGGKGSGGDNRRLWRRRRLPARHEERRLRRSAWWPRWSC